MISSRSTLRWGSACSRCSVSMLRTCGTDPHAQHLPSSTLMPSSTLQHLAAFGRCPPRTPSRVSDTALLAWSNIFKHI
jgi:hypothetical protein